LREKLGGHTTAANWLPPGLWEELDALRAEHLRIRQSVATELANLEELDQRFRDENERHAEALREAHRSGGGNGVEDRRMPPGQRARARAAVEERLWAGIVVFGEVADSIVQLVRDKEDAWLVPYARTSRDPEPPRPLTSTGDQPEDARLEAFARVHFPQAFRDD
jgi:hypothetical protein